VGQYLAHAGPGAIPVWSAAPESIRWAQYKVTAGVAAGAGTINTWALTFASVNNEITLTSSTTFTFATSRKYRMVAVINFGGGTTTERNAYCWLAENGVAVDAPTAQISLIYTTEWHSFAVTVIDWEFEFQTGANYTIRFASEQGNTGFIYAAQSTINFEEISSFN
jgi:hypothetical protein